MVIMAFVWHFIQANAITYRIDYQLVNYNNGISAHFYIIFFCLFDYTNSAWLPVIKTPLTNPANPLPSVLARDSLIVGKMLPFTS